MPLYEYQCDACGNRFESIQKFSDPPLAECPKCGGAVKKLQSAPAFQFKGSGWYITDYARKDSAPTAPAGSEGEAAKPAGDATGTQPAKDKPGAQAEAAASSNKKPTESTSKKKESASGSEASAPSK
jgi:putative FmdB family regulatory protein